MNVLGKEKELWCVRYVPIRVMINFWPEMYNPQEGKIDYNMLSYVTKQVVTN